ncbi:5689_t:CDS:2, partial [Ambispora leptoticha]
GAERWRDGHNLRALGDQDRPSVVRELKGVLCEEEKSTIGMIVAPKVTFTDEAIDCAKIPANPNIISS